MPDLLARLAPSHGIPVTRWRARTQWRGSIASYALLVLGLWLFGTGEAILINAGIGVSPWTVLAQGVSVRTGIVVAPVVSTSDSPCATRRNGTES